MQDFVPLGTGNSRSLKSSVSAGTTWEQALEMLRNGTFPIDIGAVNDVGVAQKGTPLNKSSLLSTDISTKYGIGDEGTPNNMWNLIVPIGSVLWISSETPPSSFLVCDGASLSTTDYAALFSAIGYTFGGSGAQFNLPDLRAAFIRGAGTQNGYSATFGQSQDASAISTVFYTDAYNTYQARILNQDKVTSDTNKTLGQSGRAGSGQFKYIRPFNVALTPIIKY